MENVFQRADGPDDVNRCQSIGGDGQCPFKATGKRQDANSPWEGSKYCPRHGGLIERSRIETKRSAQLYLAALWKERIGEQANHPKYKSLREEMGILRMTLERRLDACRNDNELLMYAGAVTEMVREIGKLAKVAHGIEKDMGHLLDKAQAEIWIQKLLNIIAPYIQNPDDLLKLSEDMIASLEEMTRTIE